jgi:hypothetical protein
MPDSTDTDTDAALQLFFPRMQSTEEDALTGIQDSERYELLLSKEKILPFLQTLFFEERLIEVQLDHGTRIFFAALWDHPPDLVEQEEEDGETQLIEQEYEEGAYLKEQNHIVLSPLEPVAGNMKVRTSTTVVLCFYAGTNAVELGTKFIKAESVRGASVLVFEYPTVGRIIRGSRPFRAKLSSEMNMMSNLYRLDNPDETMDCDIMDISSQGISLEHEALMERFSTGDKISITIYSPTSDPLELEGSIRHFAKIRTKQGNSVICGIQFDLKSRALAETIENLFAQVQRAFIRELAERTGSQDIQLTLQ